MHWAEWTDGNLVTDALLAETSAAPFHHGNYMKTTATLANVKKGDPTTAATADTTALTLQWPHPLSKRIHTCGYTEGVTGYTAPPGISDATVATGYVTPYIRDSSYVSTFGHTRGFIAFQSDKLAAVTTNKPAWNHIDYS